MKGLRDSERTILAVSELEHELVTSLSILRKPETLLLGAGRKAEVWEGWSDDMECRDVFSAFGELGQYFHRFEEAARPLLVSVVA